jgi:hypothetical protein
LLLHVRFDERDALLRAARQAQVVHRARVDGEHAARGAVLGRHVRDRRAVGERELLQARPGELDELADDAVLAQHLGDGQHEIGRGRALGQLARQAHADDLRDQHRHGLPEHRRLGLDAADAPTEHAETVDHRRVRVGADDGVGIGERLGAVRLRAVRAGRIGRIGRIGRTARGRIHHDARQELEVDLVHDARVGRHRLEVLEGRRSPAQEGIALLIARELDLGVLLEGRQRAEVIDLHRVIDHELDRLQRIDLLRIAALLLHRVAHRREVDDARDAGEVLQEHASGRELDLLRGPGFRVPARQGLDVRRRHRLAVLGAQQVLEQDAQRERQLGDRRELRLQRGKAVDRVLAAVDRQRAAALEGVLHGFLGNVKREIIPFRTDEASRGRPLMSGASAKRGE